MNLSCEGCQTRPKGDPERAEIHDLILSKAGKGHVLPSFPGGMCLAVFCDHCGSELDYFVVGGVIRVDLCDDCIGEALLDEPNQPNKPNKPPTKGETDNA